MVCFGYKTNILECKKRITPTHFHFFLPLLNPKHVFICLVNNVDFNFHMPNSRYSHFSLKELIAKGEGERLDFKQTITSAQKIAKTLSAFANTKGGVLLVGIKDNGSPAKIQPEEEKYMLEMSANRCL